MTERQKMISGQLYKKGNAMDLLNLTAVELGKEIKAGNTTAERSGCRTARRE